VPRGVCCQDLFGSSLFVSELAGIVGCWRVGWWKGVGVRDRQLYGVGYGGMLIEGLIEEFVGVGVRVLVDVRLHAMSRKPGFLEMPFRRGTRRSGYPLCA